MPRRNNFSVHLLSVIIPAYKQEKTIIKDIRTIEKTLRQLEYAYEIIVVVDGIVDRTYERVSRLKSKTIKILFYQENYGKGHAIRYGMLQAKGNIIGFIDAGMDIHPTGFKMLLNHMEWYNADIIVGSKLHPVSQVRYPLHRTVMSWGYRTLTWMLFGFKVKDTQVGLKFFKRKVVRRVLPLLLVKRFAFDIEMLAVSYRCGYTRIFEAPVEINFSNNTIISKNVWKVILCMLWDTLAVYYRLKILKYYDQRTRPATYYHLKLASTK